jgi:hypothetical protein
MRLAPTHLSVDTLSCVLHPDQRLLLGGEPALQETGIDQELVLANVDGVA